MMATLGNLALNATGMQDSKLVSGANTAMAVGGTAMHLAAGASSGIMKTASAIKAITDSDAYKYLQSKNIDPISLVGNALANQGGAIGGAAGMMVAASHGESTYGIAKAGMKGALGPLGGVAGIAGSMIGLEKKEEPPQGYIARAIAAGKAAYGLINRKELEEELEKDEEKKGMLATAMNLAALAQGGGQSEEESQGMMSAALNLAAKAAGRGQAEGEVDGDGNSENSGYIAAAAKLVG